jgi:hypothetical protein
MAQKKFTEVEQKLLDEAVAIGRAMQHRFRPEPLYKLTGKGYMQSEGVTELTRLKEEAARAKGVAR